MLCHVSVVRAQPVNRGGTSTYVGNPLLTETKTVDGECATAIISEANFKAGWQMYRIETDTPVYVKLGSVASATPRYMVMPGATLNIIAETFGQNVFIAAA